MQHLPSHRRYKQAFVVGNGQSRLSVDPKRLLDIGTVYGCNAQYRDYDPDYLIAVDVKMINEIIETGYHNSHQVWTNLNKGINNRQGLNFFTPHKGWSSGPTALWFAACNGHETIYILGFDYQGINGKLNNVYADTNNYRSSKDKATFFGNWLNQTERVIKEFPHVKFIRLINHDNFIPDKLKTFPNLEHMFYEKFINANFS